MLHGQVSVPVADPSLRVRARRAEIERAMSEVLDSGQFILGAQVARFERDFSQWQGSRHCIGVASGTDALTLALLGLQLDSGAEVIVPSHTAIASVAAIERAGCVPVLCDIESRSRCLDPDSVADRMGPRTQAILVVHIYGQPAPMREILDIAGHHGVAVVEDCAQAHGAKYDGALVGTLGHVGAFSFYPTKNLAALGDAGAIVTDDPELARRIRSLREYGWGERHRSESPGCNSRLDELQAAVLLTELPHLNETNRRRRQIAGRYTAILAPCGDTAPPASIPDRVHAMHLYVVESRRRDELASHLGQSSIGTSRHYPWAVHQQPAYAARLRGADDLPATEALYRGLLTLPLDPYFDNEQVDAVCGALDQWVARG